MRTLCAECRNGVGRATDTLSCNKIGVSHVCASGRTRTNTPTHTWPCTFPLLAAYTILSPFAPAKFLKWAVAPLLAYSNDGKAWPTIIRKCSYVSHSNFRLHSSLKHKTMNISLDTILFDFRRREQGVHRELGQMVVNLLSKWQNTFFVEHQLNERVLTILVRTILSCAERNHSGRQRANTLTTSINGISAVDYMTRWMTEETNGVWYELEPAVSPVVDRNDTIRDDNTH